MLWWKILLARVTKSVSLTCASHCSNVGKSLIPYWEGKWCTSSRVVGRWLKRFGQNSILYGLLLYDEQQRQQKGNQANHQINAHILYTVHTCDYIPSGCCDNTMLPLFCLVCFNIYSIFSGPCVMSFHALNTHHLFGWHPLSTKVSTVVETVKVTFAHRTQFASGTC